AGGAEPLAAGIATRMGGGGEGAEGGRGGLRAAGAGGDPPGRGAVVTGPAAGRPRRAGPSHRQAPRPADTLSGGDRTCRGPGGPEWGRRDPGWRRAGLRGQG